MGWMRREMVLQPRSIIQPGGSTIFDSSGVDIVDTTPTPPDSAEMPADSDTTPTPPDTSSPFPIDFVYCWSGEAVQHDGEGMKKGQIAGDHNVGQGFGEMR